MRLLPDGPEDKVKNPTKKLSKYKEAQIYTE